MSSGVIPNTLVLSLKFDKRFPSFEPISITKSSLEILSALERSNSLSSLGFLILKFCQI